MEQPSKEEPFLVGTWLRLLKHPRVLKADVGRLARAAYSNEGWITVVVFNETPQIGEGGRVLKGASVQQHSQRLPWAAIRVLRPLELLALNA